VARDQESEEHNSLYSDHPSVDDEIKNKFSKRRTMHKSFRNKGPVKQDSSSSEEYSDMAEYLEDDEEGLDDGEEFQGKEKINSGGLRDLGKKEKERKEREQ
jgi:hypothetical protein